MMYQTSYLSNSLLICQICVCYMIVASSYITAVINMNEIEHVLNTFIKLYRALVDEPCLLDRRLLKMFLHKIIIVDLVLFAATFSMFLPETRNMPFPMVVAWLLNGAYTIPLMIVCNTFQGMALVASTLYRNVNRRVTKVNERLSQLDVNHSHWKQNQDEKTKICKTLDKEINSLCQWHRTINETVQRLTDVLAGPMIFIMLFQFIVSIAEIYYNYIMLIEAVQFHQEPAYFELAGAIFFILLCTTQVYYTVAFCAQMAKRAEKTGVLLNEFFQSDIDERVELSIELFSLEMLHHNYKIEVYGLCTIDFTLIYSIVATMTTYLIVLIQFELADY
ncbi:putative gustatory receptor 28b [Toxorhynchites rutilus septentrionalis]|uniref:putative gustatory receptor 28b n=1 Tax=Toxorhynchites rutilus septentrionalis TaxID=329112 RepID=UPI002478844B|nr:putative gustatory receptor 28b [Toxorhynchites rutilus septentrionalis]